MEEQSSNGIDSFFMDDQLIDYFNFRTKDIAIVILLVAVTTLTSFIIFYTIGRVCYRDTKQHLNQKSYVGEFDMEDTSSRLLIVSAD